MTKQIFFVTDVHWRFLSISGFFMKYVWSATGLLIIAIPSFFFEKRDGFENTGDAISTRTKDYITAKGLLVSDSYLLYRAPIFIDIFRYCNNYPSSFFWDFMKFILDFH